MEADPLHMIILNCPRPARRPAPEADFARMKMTAVRPTGKSPNVGTIFSTLAGLAHHVRINCACELDRVAFPVELDEFASSLAS
tara:strand:- start:73 stop:324 length:252 start_codon:yes stop_codon:yes gene_type:complete